MTENYIRGNFDKVLENANAIEKRLDGSFDMKEFIEENLKNIRLCEEFGENCVLIDNEYKVDIEL